MIYHFASSVLVPSQLSFDSLSESVFFHCFQHNCAHSVFYHEVRCLQRPAKQGTWLMIVCRYLGTMPGMKPGQVLGHEVGRCKSLYIRFKFSFRSSPCVHRRYCACW